MLKKFVKLALSIYFMLFMSVVIPFDAAMAQPSINTLAVPSTSQSAPSTLSCPPPSFDYPVAQFYQDSNFGGAALWLNCRSSNSDRDFLISNLNDKCMKAYPGYCAETWNDNISSVRVNNNGCVVGWENADFSGNYIKLGGGGHGQIWSDILSSLVATRTPCNRVAIEGDGELAFYEGEDTGIAPDNQIIYFINGEWKEPSER